MQHLTRSNRAFTLTEVLVALGAVALISAGVATVFSAVGETITRGQRVSQFNSAAARFEQQIRDDLAGITRDGFLVVRHELIAPSNKRPEDFSDAEFGQLPALFEDDNNPRPRRADELLFFARGSFESARQSVDPALRAASGEAMIYYGHGIRYPQNVLIEGGPTEPDAANQFFVPQLPVTADAADAEFGDPRLRLGGDTVSTPTPTRGERGPNELAAGWTLLRRATVLRPPSDTLTTNVSVTGPASEAAFGSNNRNTVYERLQDSRWQVGGVPAAPTIFGHASVLLDPGKLVDPYADDLAFLGQRGAGNFPRQPQGLRNAFGGSRGSITRQRIIVQPEARPHLAPAIGSGLVDVAATDLDTVRRWVLTSRTEPSFGGLSDLDEIEVGNFLSLEAMELRGIRNTFKPGATPFEDDDFQPSTEMTELRRMQLWMLDALPGDGIRDIGEEPLATPFTSRAGVGVAQELDYRADRARMRYEPAPPAYFDVLAFAEGGLLPGDVANSQNQRGYRIGDQLMLSSGVLLPRCTEFIVEWSFGRTWPEEGGSEPWTEGLQPGDLIWHGLYRRGDVNSDGDIDPDEFISGPYPVYLGNDSSVDAAQFGVRWGPDLSEVNLADLTAPQRAILLRQYWPVTSELVHLDPDLPELDESADIENIRVLESVFGFADPTYAAQTTATGRTPAQNLNSDLLNGDTGDPAFSSAAGALFPNPPAVPGATAPERVDWAWPRLLRITLSLADPNDPAVEETFQFIVEIPTETNAGG